MPSAQATALTRQHRRDLGAVAALSSRQMQALTQQADPADIDLWWERAAAAALRIVTIGASTTATLAVRYLRRHAGIEGVTLAPVRTVPPEEQIATSLFVMGPVAFKTHMRATGSVEGSLRVMTDKLAGTASSRTLDGDRDTVMATFTERDQMVGWRRQLNSPKPCGFCTMLASRGAVYSKESATFEAHKPNCHCTAEPLYRHEPEPAHITRLRAEWDQVTAGESGVGKLRAWRRHQQQERDSRSA